VTRFEAAAREIVDEWLTPARSFGVGEHAETDLAEKIAAALEAEHARACRVVEEMKADSGPEAWGLWKAAQALHADREASS